MIKIEQPVGVYHFAQTDKPALLTQQHLAAAPTSQNGTPAAWTLVVLSNARRGRKITPEAFKARIDYNDKLKN